MPTSTVRLNTKMRSSMLCLSGFELYCRWVPLSIASGHRKVQDSISGQSLNNVQVLFQA